MNAQIKYTMPPEWFPQESMWMAWPSHEDLWQENLQPTQDEFTALCRALNRVGTRIELACLNEYRMKEAKTALDGLDVRFHLMPYGEIWFRDTLPLFLMNQQNHLQKARFRFNGWGGKYLLEGDEHIGDLVCEHSPGDTQKYDWVLEGGSIEVDGTGLLLTSRQCLLNPNRNPRLNQSDIEEKLKGALNVKKILWLGDGLLNDHTDGHIDTMARFVRDNEVVVMAPAGQQDPNREILLQMHHDLREMSGVKGEPLKVYTVPSAGEVLDKDGQLMPASYMNFVISNGAVIVPTYGSPQDLFALQALKSIFPEYKVFGFSARSILSGGGAFHCITQQIPKRVSL
ncbi:MAG: agmatine deiminase family protein [Bdellovibrionales bacterium]